eukprot:TRINITY_DN6642_c0_g1_i1.p1 TRINITY_DN6642_c0_g1~~TRINITY_DN6642_c0_g1_i1.p1  ORF type:complete len:430 (+),score=76.79 TRINITY_DN6642_c0_g1_i1:45-1334(+)
MSSSVSLQEGPHTPKLGTDLDIATLSRSSSQIRIRVNQTPLENGWMGALSPHDTRANWFTIVKSRVMTFFNRFRHGTTPVMTNYPSDSSRPGEHDEFFPFTITNRLSPSQLFYFKFFFYTTGLVGTFLAWGILQEKIMTTKYPPDNRQFPYSLVCILGNRLAAMVISGLFLTFTTQPTHTAPLYVYLYPSLSNLLSTTCQYEALKHISFIAQVLMKCAKVIPVMLMGSFLSHKRYSTYEYACAVFISFGTGIFMIISSQEVQEAEDDRQEFSWFGFLLMCCYLFFDSFTSTIQARLYEQYGMTSNQMMFFVNVVSTPLLFVGLFWDRQGEQAISFIHDHPSIMTDIFMLSMSGGIGQNFIYITIKDFGAVTYSIIMTVRQFLSIFSSNYLFSHNLGALQWASLSLVFMGTFMHVNAKKKAPKARGSTRV